MNISEIVNALWQVELLKTKWGIILFLGVIVFFNAICLIDYMFERWRNKSK